MSLKKTIKNNKLTRPVYLKYREIKADIHKKRQIKQMRQSGRETLLNLQTILEKTNVRFFFDMGTLLGLIREGALMSHDTDIDIGILPENEEEIAGLKKDLERAGCKLSFSYKVDGIGIVEESYMLNNIKFDINYYYRDDDYDLCYLLYRNPDKEYLSKNTRDVVMLTCPHINRIIKKKCYGVPLNVPENPELYLENRYGKNWRVPDKNYVYWKGNSAHKTDKIGIKIEH